LKLDRGVWLGQVDTKVLRREPPRATARRDHVLGSFCGVLDVGLNNDHSERMLVYLLEGMFRLGPFR
jgi:hypothetical protein